MSFCIKLRSTSQQKRERIKTHPFHIFKSILLCRILTDDVVGIKVDVDASIAHPHDDVIQAHKETTQQQHAVLVDAQLCAKHGYAIVVELALVQDDLVEEEDGVAALEQLQRDLLGLRRRRLQGRAAAATVPLVDVAAVKGRVAPVVGLDDLLDLLGGALARALPVAGVGDLEHVALRLVDGVEGGGRAKRDGPARGHVRDRDHVVAKDHLGHGDPETLREVVDDAGFGDGELARGDAEALLRVRLGRRREGLGPREGLVGVCDVVHFV